MKSMSSQTIVSFYTHESSPLLAASYYSRLLESNFENELDIGEQFDAS